MGVGNWEWGEGMVIQSYRDLNVWQKALDIAEAIYLLTKDFPQSELYGLTSQMRRASVSIAASVAEGHGRESSGAYIQFLRVSQGSLKELETHLFLAQRVGLVGSERTAPILDECDKLGACCAL